MEREINYSIIIPHKNCPDLLNRCLGSIPLRDDIHIIIVDDNSDNDKKPQYDRNNMEIIFLDAEHSRGAGHARNVGLNRAKGKWLLFADADDYYCEHGFEILDKYLDSLYDVIYFYMKIVEGNTSIEKEPLTDVKDAYQNANNSDSTSDIIKYKQNAPWNKMIKNNFIQKYNIRFEEIMQGNDIFFSYQVGYLNKSNIVIKDKIYCYVINSCSITTSSWNSNKICSYISCLYKTNAFFSFINHNSWKHNVFIEVCQRIRSDKKNVMMYIYSYYKTKKNRKLFENEYIDSILATLGNIKY